MTREQIQLIKKTWIVFRGISATTVGDVFYGKLFLDHPAVERMFPADMQQQYSKLMDMLTTIVSRIDKLDELAVEVGEMGRRHKGYGVKDEHYEWVGTALLYTLEQGLGKQWTAETKEAWTACYRTISSKMISQANTSSQPITK